MLLAVMKNCGPNGDEASRIQAAVYPALVPHSHVLASVSGSFNAVLLKGSVIGECLLYGKGAGGLPTASAVISDIADAALDIRGNMKLRIPPFPQHSAVNVRPFGETVNRYYVRMAVKRKPGTLADITAVLKDANIGIRSVVLNEKTDKGYPQGFTTLILMLHTATNASLDAALEKISELEIVGEPMIRIRVEDFE
jgi:homoserine dehydrogenase